jgi:hypothetical protein
MIDATDFREDPLYLPKDTKVFVIYDASDLQDTIDRDKLFNSYGKYGYQCSAQQLLSVDIINNSEVELGFDGIMTSRRDLSVLEIRQWYTFINVLRKARVLQKHFIVTLTGYNLTEDITRRNLERPYTIFADGAACLVSTTEADRIIKRVLSHPNIGNSVREFLQNKARSQQTNNI